MDTLYKSSPEAGGRSAHPHSQCKPLRWPCEPPKLSPKRERSRAAHIADIEDRFGVTVFYTRRGLWMVGRWYRQEGLVGSGFKTLKQLEMALGLLGAPDRLKYQERRSA